MSPMLLRLVTAAGLASLLARSVTPARARADADEAPSSNSTVARIAADSRDRSRSRRRLPASRALFRRPDGAYQAIPAVHGRTKVFHIVERAAPWTLKPGLDRHGEHVQRRRAGTGARRAAGRHAGARLHERRLRRPIRSTCTACTTSRSRWTASAASRSRSCRRADTSSTVSSPISPARSSITRTTTKRCSIRVFTARSSSNRQLRGRSNADSRTIFSR